MAFPFSRGLSSTHMHRSVCIGHIANFIETITDYTGSQLPVSVIYYTVSIYYTCSIFRELCACRGEGCHVVALGVSRQSCVSLRDDNPCCNSSCAALSGALIIVLYIYGLDSFVTPKRVLERSCGIVHMRSSSSRNVIKAFRAHL